MSLSVHNRQAVDHGSTFNHQASEDSEDNIGKPVLSNDIVSGKTIAINGGTQYLDEISSTGEKWNYGK